MNKIKTLFISANPTNTARIAIDNEHRDIQQQLRASEYRDAFEMVVALAARPEDLQEALLLHKPVIVHFSGHGYETKGLAFEGGNGKATLVSADALGHLFGLLKKNVRVVVLNACYSEEQALAIVRQIDFVVGMRDSIGDVAARKFASAFYTGLGYGETVRNAFELGVSRIKLAGLTDDENVPQLLVKVGASADAVLLDPR